MNQQVLNTETLTFTIGLGGTFWKKCPAFSIWVDDTQYVSGVIDTNEIHNYEFTAELADDTVHYLKIRLENKDNKDTTVDANGNIIKDLLLNIKSIEIDGIELNTLKWTESQFIPDDRDNRPVLSGCVDLGWNGTYQFEFNSPFYLWLLEKA